MTYTIKLNDTNVYLPWEKKVRFACEFDKFNSYEAAENAIVDTVCKVAGSYGFVVDDFEIINND